MIALRGLILVLPALLVGCASSCPGPGQPSSINERCFYLLRITHIDAASNEVRAKAGRLYDESFYSSNKIGYGDEGKDDEFSFRVKDIDMLVATNQLKVGNEKYMFTSLSGEAYLQLYTPTTTKKVMRYLKDKKYIEEKE